MDSDAHARPPFTRPVRGVGLYAYPALNVALPPADPPDVTSPDDLPRSPTGRVPQWVVDEAASRAAPAPAWVAPPPPRRRRSLVGRLAAVVSVAAVAWWLTSGVLPGVLRDVDVPLLDGVVAGRVPEPTPEIAALADEMRLTQAGRDLFYRARPELLGVGEVATRCGTGPRAVGADGAVGCYGYLEGSSVLASGPTIAIFAPDDARLRPFVVETAAHELLHAAWDELTPDEQTRMTALLEPVVAGLDPADRLHRQLAGSVGRAHQNRATELFAYVGTQVYPPGGLDPALEVTYARWVVDRAALVAVHTGFEAGLDASEAAITQAVAALTARELAYLEADARYQGDVATLASYRSVLEQQEAHHASLGAGEQSRALLSWTWSDGTVLPLAPATRTLTEARALLARDEAELAVRGEALRVEGEAVAADRAAVEAQRADLDALWRLMDPGGGGS